jgi:hypothetical protein
MDWPYCRGKIRTLNTIFGFYREVYIGQTEITVSDVILFAHTIPSVLQRTVMVVSPAVTFLTYLHMHHNRYDGPKAYLGRRFCSQNIVRWPF